MRQVLVVDDEPHIRTVLLGYLEAEGFRVVDVHICSLRAWPGDDAASPRLIAVVRGAGCKFAGHPSS